jgi:hypothetical protein
LQHLRHCQCRPDLPEKLKEEMTKRGIAVPSPITAIHLESEIEVY